MEFTKDAGVIGLALLGSTSAFSIWSAANPSVFTISQFTTEQSKKNARLGMNIGLGLCGALSAGIYLAYGKKGTLPALLTGATGVGLYALYEYMLSTSHISNPSQESMAQQADVQWAGRPGNPGAGGALGGVSGPDPSQPGAVRENWGGGNFPSRGYYYDEGYDDPSTWGWGEGKGGAPGPGGGTGGQPGQSPDELRPWVMSHLDTAGKTDQSGNRVSNGRIGGDISGGGQRMDGGGRISGQWPSSGYSDDYYYSDPFY